MESFRLVDIFSTKGIEYLLAGAFFFLYMGLLRHMNVPAAQEKAERILSGVVEWFRVPEGFLFHQGHSWARAAGPDTATLGMDDYAAKLVGAVDSVRLPAVGAKLRQGEPAWSLNAAGESIPMLSPVDGEVIAVNQAALDDPSLANRDPFGEGWLVKVKSSNFAAGARNLLTGNLARKWVEETVSALRMEADPSIGAVYQDGGLPVDGIARALYGDEWAAKVKEAFLTRE
jgi:glycine cleavage system H lipoate-binding protein